MDEFVRNMKEKMKYFYIFQQFKQKNTSFFINFNYLLKNFHLFLLLKNTFLFLNFLLFYF